MTPGGALRIEYPSITKLVSHSHPPPAPPHCDLSRAQAECQGPRESVHCHPLRTEQCSLEPLTLSSEIQETWNSKKLLIPLYTSTPPTQDTRNACKVGARNCPKSTFKLNPETGSGLPTCSKLRVGSLARATKPGRCSGCHHGDTGSGSGHGDAGCTAEGL